MSWVRKEGVSRSPVFLLCSLFSYRIAHPVTSEATSTDSKLTGGRGNDIEVISSRANLIVRQVSPVEAQRLVQRGQ